MVKSNFVSFFTLLLFVFIFSQPISTFSENLSEGEQYLAFAEEMPEPVGGLKAIYSKIKYPEIAKKSNVQGKVFLMAMINESGSVDEVKLIKGIGGGCDEAAMNAVKDSKFSVAKNKGQSVKVKLSLSIEFKLS